MLSRILRLFSPSSQAENIKKAQDSQTVESAQAGLKTALNGLSSTTTSSTHPDPVFNSGNGIPLTQYDAIQNAATFKITAPVNGTETDIHITPWRYPSNRSVFLEWQTPNLNTGTVYNYGSYDPETEVIRFDAPIRGTQTAISLAGCDDEDAVKSFNQTYKSFVANLRTKTPIPDVSRIFERDVIRATWCLDNLREEIPSRINEGGPFDLDVRTNQTFFVIPWTSPESSTQYFAWGYRGSVGCFASLHNSLLILDKRPGPVSEPEQAFDISGTALNKLHDNLQTIRPTQASAVEKHPSE